MNLGKKYRTTPEAYQLLQSGLETLAEMEDAGIRVDRDYLDASIEQVTERIDRLEERMRADPVYERWRRMFGAKTNVGSPEQLSKLVFGNKNDGGLGYTPKLVTAKTGRAAATEAAFEGLDLPFVKRYFRTQKLRKGLGTYLKGIRRELVRHADGDWYVHPSYMLNSVTTFRSSCSNPNFTNIPTRNKVLAEMVRRCYLPRRGRQLVEIDYGQIEVRISYCYHKDPTLGKYLRDPNSDMHLDMAAKLFMLPKDQVSKEARHAAKNKFVFPEYYGDFYPRCAQSIWNAIEFQGINLGKKNDGGSMKEWLESKGITGLGKCDPDERPVAGTFEQHIKDIEDWFWNVRFPVHSAWKKDWYASYLETGGFQTLSGFGFNLPLSRNDVINYGIQGDSFQCLLKALTLLLPKMRKRRMKSVVIGQIHDCLIADCPPEERDDFIDLAVRVMTEDVPRAFPWIEVGLEVEPEICPVDACWFDKYKAVHTDAGWEIKA
jgi:DNA polymerase I-like protein with 3'-5' exonuclease and polymerase domains